MTRMTPEQATDTLRKVLAMQAQGLSWRHIAVALRLESPQAAKRIAKTAARDTQTFLVRKIGSS